MRILALYQGEHEGVIFQVELVHAIAEIDQEGRAAARAANTLDDLRYDVAADTVAIRKRCAVGCRGFEVAVSWAPSETLAWSVRATRTRSKRCRWLTTV